MENGWKPEVGGESNNKESVRKMELTDLVGDSHLANCLGDLCRLKFLCLHRAPPPPRLFLPLLLPQAEL
jgi:hypothetical protein